MRVNDLTTGFALTLRELLRSRITVILLFLIPTLFYLVVDYTTTEVPTPFRLATVGDDVLLEAPSRHLSLVFIGLASVGLLTAFLALNMIQQQVGANRRLVLCGYSPAVLILSKLAVLLCVVLVVGAYVAMLGMMFFEPARWAGLAIGYVLGGYVYGCYGLLVGTLFRRELEGVLFVVLLANLDAGWLQNPVYYAAAQHTEFIHRLPAYYPSQVGLAAAFTEHSLGEALLAGFAYGSVLLLLAVFVYSRQMRIHRPACLPSTLSSKQP